MDDNKKQLNQIHSFLGLDILDKMNYHYTIDNSIYGPVKRAKLYYQSVIVISNSVPHGYHIKQLPLEIPTIISWRPLYGIMENWINWFMGSSLSRLTSPIPLLHTYCRNKETSLQVRLQSTLPDIFRMLECYKHKAWHRLGQLGLAWVHLGYI